MFVAGLETAFLGRSGIGTVWPVLSSPLKNRLAHRDEEDTLMILASSGRQDIYFFLVCLCTAVIR